MRERQARIDFLRTQLGNSCPFILSLLFQFTHQPDFIPPTANTQVNNPQPVENPPSYEAPPDYAEITKAPEAVSK